MILKFWIGTVPIAKHNQRRLWLYFVSIRVMQNLQYFLLFTISFIIASLFSHQNCFPFFLWPSTIFQLNCVFLHIRLRKKSFLHIKSLHYHSVIKIVFKAFYDLPVFQLHCVLQSFPSLKKSKLFYSSYIHSMKKDVIQDKK